MPDNWYLISSAKQKNNPTTANYTANMGRVLSVNPDTEYIIRLCIYIRETHAAQYPQQQHRTLRYCEYSQWE